MILWRPVGLGEMALVFEAGMSGFPARLAEQPLFYPVLTEEYADQIARTWNTRDAPFAGYVLQMELPDSYAAQFPPQTVGASVHRELWIPAGKLAEFNAHLAGAIRLKRAFFGLQYRGYIPEKYGLASADAYRQIAMMIGSMDYSMFDFVMEVSANMPTFFLNYPFWKAAGAERLGVDTSQLERCLTCIRTAWSSSPRPASLLEDAMVVA